jgi:hypothetical protein
MKGMSKQMATPVDSSENQNHHACCEHPFAPIADEGCACAEGCHKMARHAGVTVHAVGFLYTLQEPWELEGLTLGNTGPHLMTFASIDGGATWWQRLDGAFFLDADLHIMMYTVRMLHTVAEIHEFWGGKFRAE